MSNYCPSHDWDAYFDAEEQRVNAQVMDQLQELASAVLPSIVHHNPSLAAEDAAQLAFEHAAEVWMTRARLEAARSFVSKKEAEKYPWETNFWTRYLDVLP